MNKVVFTAGVLTVFVVGGIFFCAGLFTGANVDQAAKIVDIKDKQEIIDKIYDKIPGKPPVKKAGANDANETQNKPINIDNLLNEIVASHNTADECLLDSVKTQHKDPVTMNQAKRYVVYIGYFPNDVSEEISQLMMAKGYPIHIQISHINEEESFVFCGPFKNRKNAEKLMKWLNSHNFTNAKLVSHKLLQTDEIDLDLIEEQDDLQKNGDNRKRRTSSKKTKKNVKQDESREENHDDADEHHEDEKHDEAEEHHDDSDERKEEKHDDEQSAAEGNHEDEEHHEDTATEENNEGDNEEATTDEYHEEEENHEEPAHDEHSDEEEHNDSEEDEHVDAP